MVEQEIKKTVPSGAEDNSRQVQHAAPPHPARDAGRSRRWIVLPTVVAVAAGGYLVWRPFFATPKLPQSIVALSGRIEGDDSAIALKTGGRILGDSI